MSTTNQAYNNANKRYEDAMEKLEKFEKGEEGLWLSDIRKRLRAGDKLNGNEVKEMERLEGVEKGSILPI